ncbi:MAG: helix-turn-helix transcriptional regulator [Clostridiaceae bacterium]|nr:helix-turn-helix transcriptional regulator [Clostridiaceae bacterium]
MDMTLSQIGKRILDRRKQLRITQEELAEKAGVTPQTISSSELGKKALRPENIIKICSALEISTDYLLLGAVVSGDISILDQKLSCLTPEQYWHLDDIIDSYIAAVSATPKDKA